MPGTVTIVGYPTGDVDLSGQMNIADVTYLVAYLFTGGPAPPVTQTADFDKNGAINIADLTALVDLMFGGGS